MAISFKSLAASGKVQKTEIITSTQSWTVPADVSQIEIVLCGGGGGGTGTGLNNGYGCMGGSGSAELAFLTVTPGSTHTITIGAGGSARAYDSAPAAGGTSSFGSLLSVSGGYSWGFTGGNSFSTVNLSGKPGGKNGGRGGRMFSKQDNSSNVAGTVYLETSQNGVLGVGGGGGQGKNYFHQTGLWGWIGVTGSDGGGSGAYSYYGSAWTGVAATAGAVNTGGGGGGGSDNDFNPIAAANGGSGVAIIKYWSAL